MPLFVISLCLPIPTSIRISIPKALFLKFVKQRAINLCSHSCIEQIKRLQQNGSIEHDFSIFWVPRRTLVSNQVLEESGIVGDVNISEFPLYFLTLDQDLLSLELEDSFGDLYLVNPSRSLLSRSDLSF
jgi:hypothetical protein